MRVGSSAARLSASKLVTTALSLLTTILLARFRTLDEYGTYSQLLLVAGLVTTIFMVGLPASVNYFLARAESEEARRRFLSTYYTLSTALGAATGGVMVLSMPLVVRYFDNPLLEGFAYLLAVYPWYSVILSSLDGLLVVYERVNLLIAYRIASSVSSVGIVVLVQALGWSFSTYVFLFVVTQCIFAGSVYLLAPALSGALRPALEKKLVRAILKYSIPLGLAGSVGTLNTELGRALLGNWLSTSELAVYAIASREIPVGIVTSSLTAVLVPLVSKLLKERKIVESASLWKSALVLSLALVAFLSTALFVYAEEVMGALYSDKYVPGANVFRVYALLLLWRSAYFGLFLSASGRTNAVLASSVVALSANIGLTLLLYPVLGMLGPAVAALFSVATMQCLQLFLTVRGIGLRWSDLLPFRELVFLTLLNTAGAASLIFLKTVLGGFMSPYLGAVLALSAWMVVYAVAVRRIAVSNWRTLQSG